MLFLAKVKKLHSRIYSEHLKSQFGSNHIFSCITDTGLSRNRNNSFDVSLKIKEVDWIYVCDDDVIIDLDGLYSIAKQAFKYNVDAAFGRITTVNSF